MVMSQEECIELKKRSTPQRRPPRPQVTPHPPATLSCTFVFWAALTIAASLLLVTGYWLPYWIQGSYHQAIDVSFGSFRRCNYPELDETGRLKIIPKCGRYKSFAHIPSLSWKMTTILVGIGCVLSFLVLFILLFSCCMPYSLTKSNVRLLLFCQLLTFVFIIAGCAIYPNGWNNQEVRDACGGKNKPYQLGTCQFSLSAYLLLSGLLLLLTSLLLGLASLRKLERPRTNSYENTVIFD